MTGAEGRIRIHDSLGRSFLMEDCYTLQGSPLQPLKPFSYAALAATYPLGDGLPTILLSPANAFLVRPSRNFFVFSSAVIHCWTAISISFSFSFLSSFILFHVLSRLLLILLPPGSSPCDEFVSISFGLVDIHLHGAGGGGFRESSLESGSASTVTIYNGELPLLLGICLLPQSQEQSSI
ncbi:uncharacterized protein BO72DRAFT_46457 [Aspergillus fijiensis CBS 313.89]|uniref:Uncharacterized protein n=1 Tax=Aspergillus fijiensis CBS 313.89 TaxID=1448319 RepID=A0A8G1RV77_9EURO|nr:uncharacterized protein BO72DRAFT_46457 [Aspergillus fijiensis CBS 313.89]RAK79499.1 hypothetical protein BO72DRAFT_46457 [Aspergillus fijiensis CBS 313.89]